MDARFAVLLACFFLSGFAALLYQTAWTRELSFVFGTSELAVAAVLASYMAGLALGAAAAARYAMRLRRPVLAYGLLELAIAGSALLVPAAIRLINAIYVGQLGGGSELPQTAGASATIFQLGAAFAVLLPPTAFMGATLPLLARHAVRSDAEVGPRVGILYAVNTAGAIAGTVCAAFWLLPELGLRHTVWVGAAMNGLVFGLAAAVSRRGVSRGGVVRGAGATGGGARGQARDVARLASAAPSQQEREERPTGSAPFAKGAFVRSSWMLPAIASSGAVSFAYEVLWTRLLGHLLGSSLDAFASMLGSFLLGIALGSAAAARLATTRERAAVGFGVAQLGIAAGSYGAFGLADQLPQLSLALGAGPGAPLASAAVAAATLLPITLCVGATFPFAVRLLAGSAEQAAAATARAYAWNTVGAIVGALAAGFVLLPGLGFAGTVTLAVSVNLVLATVAALMCRPRRVPLVALAAAASLALLVMPARSPWGLLSTSPLTTRSAPGVIARAAVGRSATVLLFDAGSSFRLYANGLPEAAIDRVGLLPLPRTARMLGQLPALLRPEARELLVIGLGGGTALEPIPETVESIAVIELEPEVLRANERMRGQRAIDPLEDPRVRVHIGDARGMLQLTGKRFDAIVSQPSHPWTAGASHLYTREFFSLVRSRLRPDGVFVQWIGLKYVDEPLLRSLAATLVGVFGHVEVYQPGAAPGLLFAASSEPLAALAGARRALEAAPESHARFGIHRVEDLAAIRVLDDEGTRALAEGADQNTDDHNLLATRASRLGEAALDRSSPRGPWDDLDPLLSLSGREGLDRSVLIRRLVEMGFRDRAMALALAGEGAREEIGLGWVELGLGRAGRAARHFVRALDLIGEAGDRVDAGAADDALAGLLVSRTFARFAARPDAGISQEDLPEELAAVLAARRSAADGDWNAVAALDDELALLVPGDALYAEAARMRVHWRLAGEDPRAAADAQEIVETLLVRRWTARDALLRARAAIAAARPAAAWGALIRIAELPPTQPNAEMFIAKALEIVPLLPEEIAADLRDRLRERRRGLQAAGRAAARQ